MRANPWSSRTGKGELVPTLDKTSLAVVVSGIEAEYSIISVSVEPARVKDKAV